ncbi:DUF2812 domain-containing protein [Evansella sp. AB-rgal1]|uniref:DUF2812 domain-containing protein n=1 Tax=Evansella sp. AB-rgal1 TaxID=3242696 RepID=UPI00359DEAEA
MIKKVFRPFWSYDVIKTEEWLSSMSEQGYHFTGLKRHTRQFYFQYGDPDTFTYEICFDKYQSSQLPKALIEDGWDKVFQSKSWFVISNKKPRKEIKTSSVRENIIKRNRINYYIYCGLLAYFIMIAFINSMFLIPAYISSEGIEVVESPLWAVTYTLFGLYIALIVISIYSIWKIGKTNKQLINEMNVPNDVLDTNRTSMGMIVSREEKRRLQQQTNTLIKKRKLNWMYSPDKLEKWLEDMEEQGYNLYGVNRLGTVFYFQKGKPRMMSYCTEYQNFAKESSFSIHEDVGWKHVFSTKYSMQKWTIWSQEYTKGDEKPEIYSDQSTRLKQAKKIASSYSLLFLPLVLMYVYILYSSIDMMIRRDIDIYTINGINVILFALLILIFGSNVAKTWLYYLRLKNK